MIEKRRAVWSWAFIDWANSAFTLIVTTAFFPIFFGEYWCAGNGVTPEQGTAYLGLANSAASLVIAVLAPLLGSIADQGHARKKFLLAFTVLGCAATAALPLAARGQYVLAALLYAIAAVGYAGNTMFYDAMLTDVAEPSRYDRVSALGFALGYIGSGGLFVLCAVMLSAPARFGLPDTIAALHLSFWLTAIWWLVFTVPALLWVRETPGVPPTTSGSVLCRGFQQLISTFTDIRRDRRLLLFLGGYVLYIDGVNTVIKMAADFARRAGLDTGGIVAAIAVTQFVGFPAAIAFGRIGEKLGARRGILIGIAAYTGVCLYATRVDTSTEFFVMAIIIGLVQGGVQSLSRSFFAALIPADRGGEYFGFYNMMGRFSAIFGPTLLGVASLFLDSRTYILALIPLFVVGGWLLSKVGDSDPTRPIPSI
jgi:UMF1 family MFS transporter